MMLDLTSVAKANDVCFYQIEIEVLVGINPSFNGTSRFYARAGYNAVYDNVGAISNVSKLTPVYPSATSDVIESAGDLIGDPFTDVVFSVNVGGDKPRVALIKNSTETTTWSAYWRYRISTDKNVAS
jgi:hypothetical protein